MTFKEYLTRINKLLTKDIASQPFALAVSTVHADMSKRIFTDGKNTQNARIGRYNTTEPIYVNPNLSPGTKFDPVGKTGKSTFASTGEAHKTGYFKSYKNYRAKIGRPVGKVDLQLSDQLKINFENGVVKINNFEYDLIVTDLSKDKIDGNEERFKSEIFQMTKQEKENFDKYYEDELNEALQQ